MAEGKFFANAVTLTAAGSPVAIGKSCEATFSAEHVGLWGFGSILRKGVSKHTAKVAVKIAAVSFDPAFSTGLGLVYGRVLNGSSTTTATSITDTNRVALFTINGKFTADDGVTKVQLNITNVYFESLPFVANENEYIVFELTGEGSQITITPNHT